MHEPEHPADRGFLGLALDDVDPGGIELTGDHVHGRGVADLPTHVGDVLGLVVGRMNDEAMMTLVHT